MVTRRGYTRLNHRPEESLATALLARRYHRRLTRGERMCLALLARRPPTHHLTWSGPEGGSRDDLLRIWERARKRLGRQRGTPLLYVGCVVRAAGAGRWHLHVLLWRYVHRATLLGWSREWGLGWPKITRVPDVDRDLIGAADVVSYVLGQHSAVFGNNAHHRHEARSPGDHRFIKPHLETFASHEPEVFAALKTALDPKVTDDALAAAVPRFSSSSARTVWPSQLGRCPEGFSTYPIRSSKTLGRARIARRGWRKLPEDDRHRILTIPTKNGTMSTCKEARRDCPRPRPQLPLRRSPCLGILEPSRRNKVACRLPRRRLWRDSLRE